MHVWKLDTEVVLSFITSPIHFFIRDLSANLDLTVSGALAGQQALGSVVSAPCTLTSQQAFVVGAGDQNSGPHACTANTSPAEPSQ